MSQVTKFIKDEFKKITIKRKADETCFPSDVVDVYFYPAQFYPVTSTPKPNRKQVLLRSTLLPF